MRALQYTDLGAPPRIVTVPDPEPRAGEVLLEVTAAGLCHSDLVIMGAAADEYRFGALPLTLGHEGAGVVAAVGDGVDGVTVGEAVAVYGPWGCGRCHPCAEGKENYCVDGARPPGIQRPGALAEYLLVDDARHLVPLDGLDPVAAVPLTDAGLTPYHAIKRSLPRLGADSAALVVGVGGLGHVAVQILRALTGTTVIAVDVSAGKLEHARAVGAHHAVEAGDRAADAVRELTDGRGVDVVLDCVGAPATVALAGRVAAVEAEIHLIGVGGGALPVTYGSPGHDVAVRAPFWGSRPELIEVLELARRGRIRVDVERYGLDEAPAAYARLGRGEVRGRAVVLPGD